MHIVIPMTGKGSRFKKAGYADPKPLVRVNGVPIIERLLKTMPLDWEYTFIINQDHRHSGLAELLNHLVPHGRQIFQAHTGQGPSQSVALARDEIKSSAKNPNDGVLVSYCDYGLSWDARHFEEFVQNADPDLAVISYRGFHAHYTHPQMYAYSKVQHQQIVEIKEKSCFTDNRENEFASAGAYYFKNLDTLFSAIDHQKKLNLTAGQNEFYLSLAQEALLRKQKSKALIYEIPYFYQWGTPEDLQEFEYWEKTFKSHLKYSKDFCKSGCSTTEQVLIPMAGFGSRFKNIFQTPKPFLNLQGLPMYEKAIRSLPDSPKTVCVTTDEHRKFLKPADGIEYVYLKSTPEGQALTTFEGLKRLHPDKSVFISACDHGIVLKPKDWQHFLALKADAGVMTIQGFPSVVQSPKSFSFVPVVNEADPFSHAESVSLKKPTTTNARTENLLVGTFWFRSVRQLMELIQELVQRDLRINNEIYLDSVLNLYLEKNLIVRRVPLSGYMGWGDPDSLASTLYWEEVFGGHKLAPRQRFEGVLESSLVGENNA